MNKYSKIIDFIKSLYPNESPVPLHAPRFLGNEKKYLCDCIDSTFVSSVGPFVNLFEQKLAEYVGSKFAVATVNGTSALHVALKLSNVQCGDEVITQSLTFIATANAIKYCEANPIFIDVDLDTMGLSPTALQEFLRKYCKIVNNKCINTATGKNVKACVPMHTFGHPVKIDEIKTICDEWNIALVEDAAESLGSYYKGQHTGTFGKFGVFSFNGNKIVTSGGGGAIVTDDEELAKRAKHITTTARIPHKWEFVHDMIGYNYRLPNINAALLCAQLEQLNNFLTSKRELAQQYEKLFSSLTSISTFFKEPQYAKSNYWLNSLILNDSKQRDEFLKYTNNNGVMTRPIWQLMNKLEMFKSFQTDKLENAVYLEDRVVNIPSSVTA